MKRLIVAALLLTGCQRDSRYFGNTTPPAGQRLVYANTHEPATLDPAMDDTSSDGNIFGVLFEGLVNYNPVTSEPIAGMATHYTISADRKEYTFYLRGHHDPKGTRLADIDSLPAEFSHGSHPPPDSQPARWSDGSVVTAEDFAYSWRRFADPQVGSPYGAAFAVIRNGKEILAGKRPPDQLGVEAPDEFTLHVWLEIPAPWFLQAFGQTYPAPRRAIERARRQGREALWTQPGRMISNGPFVLKEWRPYDCLKVVRNERYYARNLVRLDEISFLPMGPGAPVIELYRAGLVQGLYADSLPPSLIPSLRTAPDFRHEAQFDSEFLWVNVNAPPFDNPWLRWAINMAIDKEALAEFRVESPARQIVPPMPGYTPPRRVVAEVKGKRYDILAHDPAGARELLAAAGYPGGIDRNGNRLTFPVSVSGSGSSAEIIRYQLQAALNVDARVTVMEFSVKIAEWRAGRLRGLVSGGWNSYPDPIAFLAATDLTGWRDPLYEAALKDADATRDPALRMKKLAQCESLLLEAMPVIPLTFSRNLYLAKPYLRAFVTDPLGNISFRYAWIDHNFKESNHP